MPAQYIVTYGHKALPPLTVWANALQVAKDLAQFSKQAVSIVNVDNIDVCPDADCKSCNHDGLSQAERDELNEAGIG